MTRNQELLDQAEAVLVANYRPLPITLVRGEGCHLFDADGARYLDLMGGIATAALGHCHPKVNRRPRRAGAKTLARLEPLWQRTEDSAGGTVGRKLLRGSRLFLQFRRRGQRSRAEVCAALPRRARGSAAGVRRIRRQLPRAHALHHERHRATRLLEGLRAGGFGFPLRTLWRPRRRPRAGVGAHGSDPSSSRYRAKAAYGPPRLASSRACAKSPTPAGRC